MAADDGVVVNTDAGMNHRIVANRHIVTNISLGINLDALTDRAVFTNIRKRTPVAVVSYRTFFAQMSGLLDAAFGWLGKFLVLFQQFREAGVSIFYVDKGSRNFLFWGEILIHQHRRRPGFVEVRFVFGIGKKRNATGLSFFNFGGGTNDGGFVAYYFSVQ